MAKRKIVSDLDEFGSKLIKFDFDPKTQYNSEFVKFLLILGSRHPLLLHLNNVDIIMLKRSCKCLNQALVMKRTNSIVSEAYSQGYYFLGRELAIDSKKPVIYFEKSFGSNIPHPSLEYYNVAFSERDYATQIELLTTLPYTSNRDDENCYSATRQNNLKLLQDLIQNHKMEYGPRSIRGAARMGYYDIVKWLFDFNHKIVPGVIDSVSRRGSISMLNWLFDRGFTLSKSFLTYAVKSNNLDVVYWAFSKKCVMSPSACSHAPSLKILECLYDNKCPWTEGVCANFANLGDLETLKWARARNCPWSHKTSIAASKGGHIHVLEWIKQNDPHLLHPSAYCKAKNLETIKWLHSNGCPWNEHVCAHLVKRKNMERLQWVRDNGCPWDFRTFHSAIFKTIYSSIPQRNPSLEIITYLVQNQCPINGDEVGQLIKTFPQFNKEQLNIM